MIRQALTASIASLQGIDPRPHAGIDLCFGGTSVATDPPCKLLTKSSPISMEETSGVSSSAEPVFWTAVLQQTDRDLLRRTTVFQLC